MVAARSQYEFKAFEMGKLYRHMPVVTLVKDIVVVID
jgi:hypothetical protein